jgi:hypothetical protein
VAHKLYGLIVSGVFVLCQLSGQPCVLNCIENLGEPGEGIRWRGCRSGDYIREQWRPLPIDGNGWREAAPPGGERNCPVDAWLESWRQDIGQESAKDLLQQIKPCDDEVG